MKLNLKSFETPLKTRIINYKRVTLFQCEIKNDFKQKKKKGFCFLNEMLEYILLTNELEKKV